MIDSSQSVEVNVMLLCGARYIVHSTFSEKQNKSNIKIDTVKRFPNINVNNNSTQVALSLSHLSLSLTHTHTLSLSHTHTHIHTLSLSLSLSLYSSVIYFFSLTVYQNSSILHPNPSLF